MRLPIRQRLTDAMWKSLATKIPDVRRCRGTKDLNTRKFIEGVLWIWRTGAPWRDLPRCFGKWFTVYKRFRRWALAGVWQVIYVKQRRAHPARCPTLYIDSTCIRVHQHAAGGPKGQAANAIGQSRGGRTTKIHAAVSSDKVMENLHVTPGQAADIRAAVPLTNATRGAVTLVADRAYDANSFIEHLRSRGIRAVIPPRRNRKHPRAFDKKTYAQRNQVERFFVHLKQNRRLATRYEKTPPSWLAGLMLSCTVNLLRRHVRGD